MVFGIARMGVLALAAAFAAPALAQDDRLLDEAVTLAAIPPAFAPDAAAIRPEGPVNLLIAAHRTAAQRYSDSFLTSGKPRRRAVATSIRLRRQDDANFFNRTRWLARRIEAIRAAEPPALAVVSTGDAFLRVLVEASRRGPIGNLVIYGHAAPHALFMREDRGFYGSVEEVARETKIVEGTEDARASQLRAMGARDLADLMELVAAGEIRFAKNAVIFFAGCGVAGRRGIEPGSIAARAAEIADATVVASIDVTDQSMGRGRSFRDHEYSRRSWVRFLPDRAAERLNMRVIDALKMLNFGGETVASGPPSHVSQASP
ncbi:MAG: hypothetical protein WCE79_14155 [Xanthobacteraceae bacterium]